MVPLPPEKRHPMAIGPQTQVCSCVRNRDILQNMNRGWRGLADAKAVTESPLLNNVKSNVWITSSDETLRRHMKYVAAHHPARWYFAVITDTDLMDSWLHHVPNWDIKDPDVLSGRGDKPTDKYTALVDLIEPPELLIICLGVKSARNSAMPEVFLEALRHRKHLKKPTWIVDTPEKQLAEGHLAWNSEVSDFLADWMYLSLAGKRSAMPSVGAICQTEATPQPSKTQSILHPLAENFQGGQRR